ncbi:MAG: hypothetical protein K8T10_10135 [Candidatus Eremiobacteraeota bacterium]|nr:hypothetical protein [Candidatus Eremiobacteraeota bacterium]
MGKKYSLQEAAKFLGIDQSYLEDIVAEGKISFDIVKDEYLIDEDSLIRIKVELIRPVPGKSEPPYTLLDDKEYINYISDYLRIKFGDLAKRIDDQHKADITNQEKTSRFVMERIDELRDSVLAVAEIDLSRAAFDRLSKILDSALKKAISELEIPAGGNGEVGPRSLGLNDIKAITLSLSDVLDDKLRRQDDIIEMIDSLEKKLTDREDEILESLEELKILNPTDEIKSRLEAFISYLGDTIDSKLDTLSKDRADVNEILDRIDTIKGDLKSGDGNGKAVLNALGELIEGQKKAKKIMIDLNVNLQKSLMDNYNDLKETSVRTSDYVRDLKESIPDLREIIEEKLTDISKINSAIDNLKASFTTEGQENLVEQIGKLRDFLDKSDNAEMLSSIDEKFKETRRALEQIFVKLSGRQQKAIVEKLERVKVPDETFRDITDRLQTIENTFPEFADIIEERFSAVDKAITIVHDITFKSVEKIGEQAPSKTGEVDERLGKIQEVLDNFQDKFDFRMFLGAFQETLDESLGNLKESQDSFQKIMVNLNINNQKAIVEKLEQLDRLNELVQMGDNIDEIAEQMQTFEAIMADINQLVDERLQTLQEIQTTLGSGESKPLDGVAQTQLLTKVDEIRSLMDFVQERFSLESMLAHIRNIVSQEGDSLKQNQEAAQKIMVNMSANSQKWIIEKLDDMNVNFDLLRDVKSQFSMIENVVPSVSDLLDVKLRSLDELKTQIKRIESGKSTKDKLGRIQKLIETEAGSIRHSLESAQKVITSLNMNNQKLMMERLNNVDLSSQAVNEITGKYQDVMTALVGQVEPGKSIVQSIDNLIVILRDMKKNLQTDIVVEKIEESLSEFKKDRDSSIKILAEINESTRNAVEDKVDQLQAALSSIRSVIDPESMISSIGEVIVEGNEILKENQLALLKLEMKNHKELLEELKQIQTLRGNISSAGSAGELLPVLESMIESKMSNFKQDLDGAHKILVNLNVNLQKQLLSKIKELVSQHLSVMEVKIDSDSLVGTVDYIMGEKLSEIKDNQESLLSLNLKTQKSLIEKLDSISKAKGQEPIADELNSMLPLIEKIVADKLGEIVESHHNAQKSLENMNRDMSQNIMEKLDDISGKVQKAASLQDMENFLPAIREALEDTFEYLNELKTDLETVKDNIKLQDPKFMGKKFEEMKKFLSNPGQTIDAISRVEATVKKNVDEQRKVLETLDGKIDTLYKALKTIYQEHGRTEESDKIQKLFARKIEETRGLEQQLVQSFQEMHEIFSQGYSTSGEDSQIQDIVRFMEDARTDQDRLSERIEQLAIMIQTIHSKGEGPAPEMDAMVQEKANIENARLKKVNDKLRRENIDMVNQLRTVPVRGGVDTKKYDQMQAAMMEKDRLLEECYREKVELRDSLDKEKRDKYEIIQKYETEKKELIDSLALERIQREKDRAELELLRAESRKKKWW